MGRGVSWSVGDWDKLEEARAEGQGPSQIAYQNGWPLPSVQKAAKPPSSEFDLRCAVQAAANKLRAEENVEEVLKHFEKRSCKCIEAGGERFEHLM